MEVSARSRYLASHAVRQMVAIVRRDETDGVWRCRYCRIELAQVDLPGGLDPRPHPERDHVVPRSRGGSGSLANRALSCQGCNVRKGDRLLSELPAEWASWRLGLDRAGASCPFM